MMSIIVGPPVNVVKYTYLMRRSLLPSPHGRSELGRLFYVQSNQTGYVVHVQKKTIKWPTMASVVLIDMEKCTGK